MLQLILVSKMGPRSCSGGVVILLLLLGVTSAITPVGCAAEFSTWSSSQQEAFPDLIQHLQEVQKHLPDLGLPDDLLDISADTFQQDVAEMAQVVQDVLEWVRTMYDWMTRRILDAPAPQTACLALSHALTWPADILAAAAAAGGSTSPSSPLDQISQLLLAANGYLGGSAPCHLEDTQPVSPVPKGPDEQQGDGEEDAGTVGTPDSGSPAAGQTSTTNGGSSSSEERESFSARWQHTARRLERRVRGCVAWGVTIGVLNLASRRSLGVAAVVLLAGWAAPAAVRAAAEVLWRSLVVAGPTAVGAWALTAGVLLCTLVTTPLYLGWGVARTAISATIRLIVVLGVALLAGCVAGLPLAVALLPLGVLAAYTHLGSQLWLAAAALVLIQPQLRRSALGALTLPLATCLHAGLLVTGGGPPQPTQQLPTQPHHQQQQQQQQQQSRPAAPQQQGQGQAPLQRLLGAAGWAASCVGLAPLVPAGLGAAEWATWATEWGTLLSKDVACRAILAVAWVLWGVLMALLALCFIASLTTATEAAAAGVSFRKFLRVLLVEQGSSAVLLVFFAGWWRDRIILRS